MSSRETGQPDGGGGQLDDLQPSPEPSGEVVFVVDDAFRQYMVPWELAKDWGSFEAFVKDVYQRNKSEYLNAIEEGRFDVTQREPRGILLPSVWNSTIRPHVTVDISPWSLASEPPVVIRRSEGPRSSIPSDFNVGSNDDEFAPAPIGEDPFGDDLTDGDNANADENGGSDSEPAPPPERIRAVQVPIDDDGNELAITVNTKWDTPPWKVGRGERGHVDFSSEPADRPKMTTENYRITRAMSVVTDGRTTLQIHTLSGPENSTLSSSVHIRWHHLYAESLSWVQFKTFCLDLPGLSDRMHKVMTKLFVKLEEGHVKHYLKGMFFEPGTVLRADEADESGQTDLQSVIFSCIPYFEIMDTHNTISAVSETVFPPRTLLESYYPSKPVQERDDEQAFRKFENKRKGGLVYVPSMWMLNIGSDAVVTCGYRPLASELKKSINVVPDDIKQLSLSMKENKTTTIRLTDWDKRVLIYQRDECRTYFEMERKLRVMRFSPGKAKNSLQLLTNTHNGIRRIQPAVWPFLVSQRNVLFIDLFVTNDPELNKIDKGLVLDDLQPYEPSLGAQNSIPPFFHWPATRNDENVPEGAMPLDADRQMRCLAKVEKDLVDVGILKSNTIGVVDQTFTSSAYYEELPEVNFNDFLGSLKRPPQAAHIRNEDSLNAPFHTRYVNKYCSKLTHEINDFVDVVSGTVKLFVSDMDESILLRRLWGSLTCLVLITERTANIQACEVDPQVYLDSNWKPRLSKNPSWWIRPPRGQSEIQLPLPQGKEKFVTSIKSCRKCRLHPFKDVNTAIEHLRAFHLEEDVLGKGPATLQSQPNAGGTKELREWVTNGDQWVVETTVYGAALILSQATKEARRLLELLQELTDGVRNEDARLSPLYTFPRKLLGTFHQLVILYFAVERSLHYIEEGAKPAKESDTLVEGTTMDDITKNSVILRRFSDDVGIPLIQVREDLCNMTRSKTFIPLEERIVLGPEYICSWLMRKLIVKPLDNGMTVVDIYNDYLSTLEFQVSHRPGKRLLRSIKLVQEEIKILQKVTHWQTRQISNYSKVLDDATYATLNALYPSRRVMFPFDYALLASCLDNLTTTRNELTDQYYLRCDPLSETAKQSAEINEEDHGKAIFVFTVVTAIFLPLSFITSYLGMNTADIRDMKNSQALFWEIAAPLTVAVMGTVLFVAYNGDEMRDLFSSLYRTLTGKQPRDITRRTAAAQRKRATRSAITDVLLTADSSQGLAEQAEYAAPHPLRTENSFPYTEKTNIPAPKVTLYNTISTPDVPTLEPRMIHRLNVQAPSNPMPRRHPGRTASPLLGPSQGYSRKFGGNDEAYHRRPNHENDWHYDRDAYYNQDSYIPSHARNLPLPPPLSTFPREHTQLRLHRKYLAPETLAQYEVAYELDPRDSDYVIIQDDVDENTLKLLHDQSKQLVSRNRTYGVQRAIPRMEEDDDWYPPRAGERLRGRRGYRSREQEEEDVDEWYGETRERRGRTEEPRRSRYRAPPDGDGYVWVRKRRPSHARGVEAHISL